MFAMLIISFKSWHANISQLAVAVFAGICCFLLTRGFNHKCFNSQEE